MTMPHILNEKILPFLLVIAGMCIFFGFGFYHIAQFETTDEHLWKYDRIPQYWHAIATQNWTDTYINDKPGITVALISGIGLLFESDPIKDQFILKDPLFEQYDPQRTLHINYLFRLPILIFATLSLLGFFLLLRAAYNDRIASLTTIIIATHPILLGMSQIINPDSFFWICGGLAICAHIALVHTHQKKFLILCGILTGFAFLSKYTAYTLFLFFVLYDIGYFLFTEKKDGDITLIKKIVSITANLCLILAIASGVFALFLPAVFSQPLIMFKGIAQFLTVKKTIILLLCLGAVVVSLTFLSRYHAHVHTFLQKANRPLLLCTTTLLLCVFGIVFLNTWTGQNMIPFDHMRDAVYANEPQSFNFKPFLTDDAKIIKKIKAYFLEAYPIVFSMTPLMLFAIIGGSLWSIRKKAPRHILPMTFAATSFLLIYFALTVMARVVINARYSIILYPILAIWCGLIVIAFFDHLKLTTRAIYGYTMIILLIGSLALWNIRPFYFSYTNFLLPRQFSIHDSWGHGAYEAATYLNTLPNADQLIIWSNSDTVCRFFVGKCLRNRKIDLSLVTPDYFVISKRGAIKERNHFTLENNPHPQKDATYYFSHLHDRAMWMLLINDRPDNYLLIVPYEKN